MLVVTCGVVVMFTCTCFCVNMVGVAVPCMSCVVVAEAAGGEGCDEDCQTDEHADAFPCEVARFFSLARNDSVVIMFTGVVVELEAFAIGLNTTIFVVMLVTMLSMLPVIDLVHDDAGSNCDYK